MKTNYRLIILEQGNIIVSDEEIKKNDWKYCSIQKKPKRQGEDKQCICDSKKIIAGLKNQPSIDYNGLEEKFGIVDWSKHWEIVNQQLYEQGGVNPHAYRLGFKKAQSLNDKKFSLEDIKKAIQEGSMMSKLIINSSTNAKEVIDYYNKQEEKIIQSLQQPKVFDIEVEVETCSLNINDLDCHEIVERPKITNNSIKITKVL